MSQMYETKSLKPNFLSSFSLMFIGLPFLCSEMGSLNLRFPHSLSLLKIYWAVFWTQSFCRCELCFLAEYPTYGGVRGKVTKVGLKNFRFPTYLIYFGLSEGIAVR